MASAADDGVTVEGLRSENRFLSDQGTLLYRVANRRAFSV